MTAATWSPAQIPTAADDCLLISTSGPVTIGSGSVCRSLDLTGYTNTVTHTAGVTLTIGDATAGASNIALAFPTSGWTYTLGNATTSAITFISTSTTTQTVNFGGKTPGSVTFNAASNGSWQYTGAHTSPAAFLTLTKGSLDLNGQTVSLLGLSATGALVRSLTLGSAAITLAGTGSGVWDITNPANLTFSGASATLTFSGASPIFAGGALTYGTVNFTGAADPRVNGANTFGALNRTGTNVKTSTVLFGADQVVTGTLTLAGTSTINRLLVQTDTIGTPRTLTAGTVAASYIDVQDITGAGADAWALQAITGLSGDCGGNSGITFTTAASQASTGTASFTWSTHGWTSRVPLPQDDVVISNIFVSGRTVTMDMPRMGKNITWAGATWAGTAPTWTIGTNTIVYGSVTKVAGMLHTSTGSVRFEGRGAFTLANAGVAWPSGTTISMINGSLTLLDAWVGTAVVLANGTFNDGGFATTFANSFVSTSNLTRAFTHAGAMTLSGTGAVLTMTSTGMTYTSTGSSITLSDTSSTSKTVAGGGLTYGRVLITGGGTGSVDITGANTFAGLTVGAPKTIRFTAATTTTFTTPPVLAGSSGNVITLSSITAATHTLSCPTGIIQGDYLSVTNSLAGGGATWVAGWHSTNGGGNTGWLFNTVLCTPARWDWQAPDLTLTRTVVCVPAQEMWQSTGLDLSRGLAVTPGRWTWCSPGLTLQRLVSLSPAHVAWCSQRLDLQRLLALTPARVAWRSQGFDVPSILVLTPAQVVWFAQMVEGVPSPSHAARPLVLEVRQTEEVLVLEGQRARAEIALALRQRAAVWVVELP